MPPVPEVIVSFLGAIFALSLDALVLKYAFAGFLCLVGVLQIVLLIIDSKKKKENVKKQ